MQSGPILLLERYKGRSSYPVLRLGTSAFHFRDLHEEIGLYLFLPIQFCFIRSSEGEKGRMLIEHSRMGRKRLQPPVKFSANERLVLQRRHQKKLTRSKITAILRSALLAVKCQILLRQRSSRLYMKLLERRMKARCSLSGNWNAPLALVLCLFHTRPHQEPAPQWQESSEGEGGSKRPLPTETKE